MKIKSIRVRNYKSIQDSGELELGPSFTAIVGQNNAGKTAFLERLSFSGLKDNPYLDGNENEFFVPNPFSTNEVVLEFSGAEFDWLIRKSGGGVTLQLDGPNATDPGPAQEYYDSEVLKRTHTSPLLYRDGHWFNPSQRGETSQGATFKTTPDREKVRYSGRNNAPSNSMSSFLAQVASGFSYVFKAERLNVAFSDAQGDLVLRPNAANLAGALLQLQGRHGDLFEKINDHLRAIIPSVQQVTVARSEQGSDFEIRVWNKGTKVSHSLADSGTGIGQVLAMLFVVVTSRFGLILVIDEPNSFLHPSACRALMNTLKQYSQHQYVVATHATEIISAIDPDVMIVVRWDDGQSRFTAYRRKDEDATRHALDEVGARLSDVFGHDAIIWVEGRTEAICFPKLASSDGISASSRIGYVAIINTGDLLGSLRNPELAWQLYETLSKQSALMPRALAFSLDRENWKQQDMEDLRRRSRNRVEFLPRRTYENYLLHPEAVSAVFHALGGAPRIMSWMQARGSDPAYLQTGSWDGDIADHTWLQNVDGAKLLADLVSELSQSTYQYIKTTHSPAITEWLLANQPNHLNELKAYVLSLHCKD